MRIVCVGPRPGFADCMGMAPARPSLPEEQASLATFCSQKRNADYTAAIISFYATRIAIRLLNS